MNWEYYLELKQSIIEQYAVTFLGLLKDDD